MIINEKIGRLNDFDIKGRTVDWLQLEWFESSKRILHKRTASGRNLILKFLNESPSLQQDDIIYADEKELIAIAILPCDVIVINPASMYQMAAVCYEIGNEHLPLYWDENKVMVPYDAPVFRMLQAAGFTVTKEHQKLLHLLKTSVAPHGHSSSESLFSKILKLTTAPHAT